MASAPSPEREAIERAANGSTSEREHAESTPAATRRCTAGDSLSSRNVLLICGRDRPIRVLWHMHRGMVRFYGKFFRHQYPRPFMWLVFAGVWLRFTAAALRALVRGR